MQWSVHSSGPTEAGVDGGEAAACRAPGSLWGQRRITDTGVLSGAAVPGFCFRPALPRSDLQLKHQMTRRDSPEACCGGLNEVIHVKVLRSALVT